MPDSISAWLLRVRDCFRHFRATFTEPGLAWGDLLMAAGVSVVVLSVVNPGLMVHEMRMAHILVGFHLY